jgi:hypothetical protein
MRPAVNRRSRAKQRGWAGLVVILLALVIVALLAKDALKQYVSGAAMETKSKTGTAAERARAPGAVGAEALDVGSAPPTPAAALERARGVEDMVKQQADERAARVDGAAK